MIDLKDICKVYLVGDERVMALDHATLHIHPHEFVSIIGPSGSGKSTLMNIIGCLDVADAGSYMIFGLAGFNFLIELGVNILLAPVITRLIKIAKK